MKSVRIINRLNNYLTTYSIDLKIFFDGIIQKQVVKTKTSQPEIEIISSKKFFERLAQAKIRKSSTIYERLSKHIFIDPKYKQILMFKKLKKFCSEIQKSKYFQTFGERKRKLDLETFMLE